MQTKNSLQYKVQPTFILKDKKNLVVFCPNHPDKKATYCLKDDTNQKFCTKCALTLGGALSDQIFIEKQKIDKKLGIEKMKSKIQSVRQEISSCKEILENRHNGYQLFFHEQIKYLKQNFEKLYKQLQQKQKQLEVALIRFHRQAIHSLKNYQNTLQSIETSVSKYLKDIDINYDDIIQQLSMQHYEDIMTQYTQKLMHYQEKIKGIQYNVEICPYSMHVPTEDIQKSINKAIIISIQSDEMAKLHNDKAQAKQNSLSKQSSRRNLKRNKNQSVI